MDSNNEYTHRGFWSEPVFTNNIPEHKYFSHTDIEYEIITVEFKPKQNDDKENKG